MVYVPYILLVDTACCGAYSRNMRVYVPYILLVDAALGKT